MLQFRLRSAWTEFRFRTAATWRAVRFCVVATMLVIPSSNVAPAQAQNLPPTSARQAFAIPSQALEAALQRLGREAELNILYENGVADGRRSTRVAGTLTSQEALARMLMGTGLTYRFTHSNGAVVFPPDRPPLALTVPTTSSGDAPRMVLDPMRVRAAPVLGDKRRGFESYGQEVIAAILPVLRADPLLQTRFFRSELIVRVAPDGTIAEAHLEPSTGVVEVDLRISAIAKKVRVAVPPSSMPQPIRFEVAGR